jgi:hypothetical protein
MTTIYYQGYQAAKGTTRVMLFWSDIHASDFRAELPITTHAALKEQVEKFRRDNAAFDVTDYACGTKFIKANREYDCLVERNVDFYCIVFKYEGKTYRTRTNKLSKALKIRKQADEVLEYVREQVACLVSDATGEVMAENAVLRRRDILLENELQLY